MDWSHLGILVLVGVSGGVFGSMMGVGGGVFVVPLLTLALKLPLKEAVACSLVAVAGTACASAASYVRSGFTNIRLGLLLETATCAGAVGGALVAALLNARLLAAFFAAVLVYTCVSMGRRAKAGEEAPVCVTEGSGRKGFNQTLSATYRDSAAGCDVSYGVKKVGVGLGASVFAGVLSGLLGVGGGVVKVPVMNLAMGVPMKAALGTSSFMIGITAIASSFVYYQKGYLDAMVAGPVLIGVFIGAQAGVRLVHRLHAYVLRFIFAGILGVVAILMALRAAGVMS